MLKIRNIENRSVKDQFYSLLPPQPDYDSAYDPVVS